MCLLPEGEAAAGCDELAALLSGDCSDPGVERALKLLGVCAGLTGARDQAAERARVACGHLKGFGERSVFTALERVAHYALDEMGCGLRAVTGRSAIVT